MVPDQRLSKLKKDRSYGVVYLTACSVDNFSVLIPSNQAQIYYKLLNCTINILYWTLMIASDYLQVFYKCRKRFQHHLGPKL